MTAPGPRAIAAGVVTLVVALWQSAVHLGWVSATFLPAPTTIAVTLGRELSNGLLAHFGLTMLRVFGGLVLGAGAGLLLGLAMGMWPRLRHVVDPFIAALHPIPKLALLPLLMLLLGIGEAPRLAVVAAGSFFPMLLNTVGGVRQIHPLHFEVARSYGASERQLWQRVAWPGSIPMILTGLRVAANLAFLTTIAVEMVGAGDGLGGQLWLAWQTLRVDLLFAVLALIAVVGVSIAQLLRAVAARGAPWLSDSGSHI